MAKQNNSNINPDTKNLEKFLKDFQKLEKSGFNFSDSLGKSSGFLGSISSQIFGIDKSEFFEKIKYSEKNLFDMKENAGMLADAFGEATEAVNKGFSNALNSARGKGIKVSESISLMTSELSKKMPEIAREIQDAFNTKNLANLSPEAMKQFRKIVKDKEGFGKLNDFFKSDAIKGLKQIETELKQVQIEIESNGNSVINWGKGLNKVSERLTKGFDLIALTTSMKEFDQTIIDAQRNSGLFLADTLKTSSKFAELTSYSQQFGMNMKDNTELMGQLGGILRTTDVGVLSDAARDMAAIKNSTGLAVGEVSELGGQMMLMGKSSKDVSKFAETTMKSAINFGVNGRKVMQDIVKNIPKFRQMGFQGGEESLKKMALQAEHLGQNIDELFDMSSRARNIEGALDMASQLQLAGGSFANINPMDLLSAARKSPQELQKILGQMGKDIGKFDKVTGDMAFDAVDFDRLTMIANATGLSVDSLQKQIMTMNKDAQKAELIPPGLFDSLDDEERAFLLKSIGKDGSLSMSIDGVGDINKLTSTNVSEAIKQANLDKGNLEDQAKQNTSFQESVKNLKDSIMNAFVVFEPVIKFLTDIIQKLNSMFSNAGTGFKVAFAVLLGGVALLFSAGKQFLSGIAFGKGHKAGLEGGGIAGILGKKKSTSSIPTPAGSNGIPEGNKPGGFLQSLSEGLKSFGTDSKKIIQGAGTLALSALLVGGALVALTWAIAKMGGDASGGQLLTFGVALVGLAGSLWLVSKIMSGVNVGSVIKGSIAMGIIGLALIPFSYAMTMLQGVSWETLGKAAVGIIGLSLIVAGLGAIMSTGVGALILGAGVVFLIGLGIGMAALGGGLLLASSGFLAMSTVNWGSLLNMGPALLTIAAAGALGLVGSFGILGMAFSLGTLASVMVVLAPALQMASNSMNTMAEGIEKLNSAVKSIDTAKLESLASSSERLSTASAIGSLVGAVSGIFGGVKEEKEQKISIQPIQIDLKINGRFLQQLIIDDSKLSA